MGTESPTGVHIILTLSQILKLTASPLPGPHHVLSNLLTEMDEGAQNLVSSSLSASVPTRAGHNGKPPHTHVKKSPGRESRKWPDQCAFWGHPP